jgi:hypothetical protein
MILLKTIIHTGKCLRNGKYIVANRVLGQNKSKVGNLYFTGQLTVPGPGVPPALISGKLVSDLIKNNFRNITMKQLFDDVSFKCSKLQNYSTSFSLAVYMLSPSIRDAIYSIYGFVRFADEIVDSFHGFNKEELINDFKRIL